MAENLICKAIKQLINVIKDAEFNNASLNTVDFYVIGINRYITDPVFSSQTVIDTSQTTDAFDITLSDEKNKTKVILHSSMNHLLQSNQLHVGCLIKLKKCYIRFDEADLQSESFIIVKDLEISGKTEMTRDFQSLVWWPESNLRQKEDRPLASIRGYYINVWSTAYIDLKSLCNTTQDCVEENFEESRTKYGCCYGVTDIYKKWKSLQGSKPAILVKVLKISRLLHYVRPQKSDRWPFQLHVLIGDNTGCCTAVLWNILAVKYLNVLKEGKCLLLQNFTTKKSFHSGSRWKVGDEYGELYEIDINVNPHHPTTIVQQIKQSSIDENSLPDIHYHFFTRKQLRSVYENVLCDVIGYVQFVGRVERERMKNRLEGDSGCYWIYRWLHIVDHTSYKPIIIQLYTPNQYEVFDNLKVGDVIICRHLQVLQDLESLQHSKQPRFLYLSSTTETQVNISDLNDTNTDTMYNQPVINQFMRWYRSNQSKEKLHYRWGGYYVYPPLPNDLQSFKYQYPDVEITNSSVWESVINNIVYRHHTRLYVQAVLAQVKFIRRQTDCKTHCLIPEISKSKKTKFKDVQEIEEISINEEWCKNKDLYKNLGVKEQAMNMFPLSSTSTSVKSRISFPDTVYTDNSQTDLSEPEYQKENYFEISWLGLNSKVVITSMKVCNSLSDETTFSDILHGHLEKKKSDQFNYVAVSSVLDSASQLKDNRYFIVLDLYRHSVDDVEIMLNIAYSL